MQTAFDTLFDERRAAESAAFLLFRAGGSLPLIKLLKLIYLAERLCLQRFGEPLTGDHLVSMEHGPVLSSVYNLMNGALRSQPGGWETWVSDRSGHTLALKDPSMIRSPEDLMGLSESDLEVLEEVWSEFGHWDRWALVKYTHDNLPEWEDPKGSSNPIPYARLFQVLGYSEPQVEDLTNRLSEQKHLNAAFR